jgi:hypothetical protein
MRSTHIHCPRETISHRNDSEFILDTLHVVLYVIDDGGSSTKHFILSSHHHLRIPPLHEMAPRKRDAFKEWLSGLFTSKDNLRDIPDGLCFDHGARFH